jgi:hypothetical protein
VLGGCAAEEELGRRRVLTLDRSRRCPAQAMLRHYGPAVNSKSYIIFKYTSIPPLHRR